MRELGNRVAFDDPGRLNRAGSKASAYCVCTLDEFPRRIRKHTVLRLSMNFCPRGLTVHQLQRFLTVLPRPLGAASRSSAARQQQRLRQARLKLELRKFAAVI